MRKGCQRSVAKGVALSSLMWCVGGATLQAGPGDLDPTFTAEVNGSVESAVLEPSGKILIGGNFTRVNGSDRNYIARLNSDGSLDTTFDAGNYPGRPVKQVLRGVGPTVLANVGDTVICLYSDGSRVLPPSTNFPPPSSVWAEPELGDPSHHITVMASATFPLGSLYIGGTFFSVWDASSSTYKPRTFLARINQNGRLDSWTAQTIDLDMSYEVFDLAVQPGYKLLVAGYVGVANNYFGIFRLHSSGTVDTSFSGNPGRLWQVTRVVPQPDGKVLIAGRGVGGGGGDGLMPFFRRLNADRSVDTDFGAVETSCRGVFTYFTSPILLLPNGRIVTQTSTDGPVIGSATVCQPDKCVRLNSDGSLDPAFRRTFFVPLAAQPDGNILVASYYDPATGVRSSLARLIGKSDARFESVKRLADQTVRLKMSGEPTQKYAIEVSTTVTSWTRLATNESPVGLWDFTDSSATNLPQRFYRAVAVP